MIRAVLPRRINTPCFGSIARMQPLVHAELNVRLCYIMRLMRFAPIVLTWAIFSAKLRTSGDSAPPLLLLPFGTMILTRAVSVVKLTEACVLRDGHHQVGKVWTWMASYVSVAHRIFYAPVSLQVEPPVSFSHGRRNLHISCLAHGMYEHTDEMDPCNDYNAHYRHE